jgi:enamine deaminase RidA (YjgF/YER057c/UK114 family)
LKIFASLAVSHSAIVAPPRWVGGLLSRAPVEARAGAVVRQKGTLAQVTAVVTDAERMGDDELQARTADAYGRVLDVVRELDRHPVRFWNHVPQITAPASQHRDRYMVFNAGRYEAFVRHYASSAAFDRRVATASAVGTSKADLVVHCLASMAPGAPFNNPRQVAPYHYSKRFGPLPPCFARATRLAQPENLLLVGGTAAIRGEDSVFREDLDRQARETFVNMAALVATAQAREFQTRELGRDLACYRELRVYLPNAEHKRRVGKMIRANFSGVRRVEFVQADLCRPDLLVEIEGIAELP